MMDTNCDNNNLNNSLPLFTTYPSLLDKIPRIPLADLPTPVQKMEKLGQNVGLNDLYIKRDGLTSKNVYGGNKVRKLEFILADAKQKGAETIITGGGIGSNFSLATTIWGQKLGLNTILLLMEHPISSATRINMLAFHHYKAQMIKVSEDEWDQELRKQIELNHARHPYAIPLGGSNELGATGFVNAAFELKEQVEDGVIPEPDYIFVTAGSLSTFCGLWLGCKLANLNTQVVGISVYVYENPLPKAFDLINRTNNYLLSTGTSLPELEINSAEIVIVNDYRGEEYAKFTLEGKRAVELAYSLEGIKLEGTYTGKTLAGLLGYIKKGSLNNRTVLFWDTYAEQDLSDITKEIDYHQLPIEFQKYFELPCQDLDIKF